MGDCNYTEVKNHGARKIEVDGTRQEHQGLNVIEIETQKNELDIKRSSFSKARSRTRTSADGAMKKVLL